MTELTFLIEEMDGGGYTARALDHSIFTEVDARYEIHAAVRDAVRCHFGNDGPKLIRLRFAWDEVIAA